MCTSVIVRQAKLISKQESVRPAQSTLTPLRNTLSPQTVSCVPGTVFASEEIRLGLFLDCGERMLVRSSSSLVSTLLLVLVPSETIKKKTKSMSHRGVVPLTMKAFSVQSASLITQETPASNAVLVLSSGSTSFSPSGSALLQWQ